jgi:hypothetical protein
MFASSDEGENTLTQLGPLERLRPADTPFENWTKFKYFRAMLTNPKCSHERIKSRLNSRNGCYNSVQNLVACYLESRR